MVKKRWQLQSSRTVKYCFFFFQYYEETLPRSSPSSTRGPYTNMSRLGIIPRVTGVAGAHSSKELFEQIVLLLFKFSTYVQ